MSAPEWPPLATVPVAPAFPVAALPQHVKAWVRATSEATQTPIDLAACAALGTLSAAVAGGVAVDVVPGWREECVLYVVLGLESGDRKSAVLRAATDPLRQVERTRQEAARPHVAEARSERDALEQRRKTLTTRAAKADDPAERGEITREAGEIGARLGEEPEPAVPRLLADDCTPEALAGLLAQHGRIAVVAAESAFLDNLAGRYSEGRGNLHLACSAFTGEATSVDRRGRDPEHLDRPLLTLALSVQPHVLAALVADTRARDQGLVGRTILVRPETRLGNRVSNPPPVPSETTERWADVVRRLADTTDTTPRIGGSVSSVSTPGPDFGGSVSSVSPPGGRSLRLSEEANRRRVEVAEHDEPRLADGGDLRPVADWYARFAGRTIRVAALLHLAAGNTSDEVDPLTFEAALEISQWSLAHALAVLTGPSAEVTKALQWLTRNGDPVVSERDLLRGPQHSQGTKDTARVLAEELVAFGALRPQPPPETGPQGGRPPSPRYDVHPELVGRGGDPAGPVFANGELEQVRSDPRFQAITAAAREAQDARDRAAAAHRDTTTEGPAEDLDDLDRLNADLAAEIDGWSA